MEEVIRIVGIGLISGMSISVLLALFDSKRWMLWLVACALLNVVFFWAVGFDGLAPDFEL